MQNIAVTVAKYLKFDIERALKEILQVNSGDSERLLRLLPGRFPQRLKLLSTAHDAHAPSSAACGGFDDQGVADAGCFRSRGLCVSDDSFAARHNGNSCGGHLPASVLLLAHQAQNIGRRSNKSNVRSLANLCEVRILGKKSVARMYGVYIRDFGGTDHVRNIQVALGAACRADTYSFIGKTHVQRIAIR